MGDMKWEIERSDTFQMTRRNKEDFSKMVIVSVRRVGDHLYWIRFWVLKTICTTSQMHLMTLGLQTLSSVVNSWSIRLITMTNIDVASISLPALVETSTVDMSGPSGALHRDTYPSTLGLENLVYWLSGALESRWIFDLCFNSQFYVLLPDLSCFSSGLLFKWS